MAGLHVGLVGDLQRIVNFDPQIPDGTLELRVSEQQPNRVPRSLRDPKLHGRSGWLHLQKEDRQENQCGRDVAADTRGRRVRLL